ncbi:hypothetical protein B0T20DRAFT_487104 [Sordaria brevicollis]|uniref:Uncharacterized protein n=1 Tax=Sordaria brevicollis TaxID=83679 RepID=A0AAE0U9S1_SORBR|nr:hypothetical protein B0T20DRAFT_487104 [Sordaria brevicollis]
MELVNVHWKYCEYKVGRFINLWTKVDDYVCPNIKSGDNLGYLREEDRDPRLPEALFSSELYDDEWYRPKFGIEHIVKHPDDPYRLIYPDHDHGPSRIIRTSTTTETRSESGDPRCFEVEDISPSQNEKELADLRAQVSELQYQVNLFVSKAINNNSATDLEDEVATLRAENAELRRLLTEAHPNNHSGRSIPSTELDIQTSGVSKTVSRADQVDIIQMAPEISMGREEKLKANWTTDETLISSAGMSSAGISSAGRKRTWSETGHGETDLARRLHAVSTPTTSLPVTGSGVKLPEYDQNLEDSIEHMGSGRGERN